MAGDEGRPWPAHVTAEGLDVAAADAVGLDAQQAIVSTRLGPRELAQLQLAGGDLDCGPHHVSHSSPCR